MDHAVYCLQFIPSNGTVLDVGSGRGKFICAMAQLGKKAYGVELSPGYIRETTERALELGVAIEVRLGRAEKVPFSENYFNFVNCAEVTEHVENPVAVCQEIYRVLKPGGKCYISFHNRFGWYDYHYQMWLVNWLPRSWADSVARAFGRWREDSPQTGRQTFQSMHYYTYASAERLLLFTGFIIHDIREMKIRERCGRFTPGILLLYKIFLRPLYFNTFHMLIEK